MDSPHAEEEHRDGSLAWTLKVLHALLLRAARDADERGLEALANECGRCARVIRTHRAFVRVMDRTQGEGQPSDREPHQEP